MSPVDDEPPPPRTTGDTMMDAILDYGAACDQAGRAEALGDTEAAEKAGKEIAWHMARLVALLDAERTVARQAARSPGGRERNTAAQGRWKPPGIVNPGE